MPRQRQCVRRPARAPRGVCRLEEGQAEDSECPQCAPLASLRLEVWICWWRHRRRTSCARVDEFGCLEAPCTLVALRCPIESFKRVFYAQGQQTASLLVRSGPFSSYLRLRNFGIVITYSVAIGDVRVFKDLAFTGKFNKNERLTLSHRRTI